MVDTIERSRFKDALWFPKLGEGVIVGGAGGIGSWLSLFLARANFEVTVYDYDKVEAHNLGGQLYRESSIERYKVDALQSIITDFAGTLINTRNEKFGANTMGHHFMLAAFDNMQARRDMFNVWKNSISYCTVTPLFIDGRLEMEQLQIYCVTPDNMDEYEANHLFADHEADTVACTLKQTTHVAATIAGLMTAFFTNHITNIYEAMPVRHVPFFYEMFLPMGLKTEDHGA